MSPSMSLPSSPNQYYSSPKSPPHHLPTHCIPHLLLLFLLTLFSLQINPTTSSSSSTLLTPSNHTSNAAIIVSTSRYWHNYRHTTNALAIYKVLKSLGGFSDDNIILMLADDIPCNARNPFKSSVYRTYANGGAGDNLFNVDDSSDGGDSSGGGVEVDYRGTDVTIDAFRRVLLGRHLPGESSSRQLLLPNHLLSPNTTNLLVFLTGHGGDQFFKFQDGEEITTHDLQSLFAHLKTMGKFKEALVILDTCQAFSMADGISVEGVRVIGSSLKGENSYAHHGDEEVGLSVVDRFTHHFVEFLERRMDQWKVMNNGGGGGGSNNKKKKGQQRLLDTISIKKGLVDSMSYNKLGSHVGLKDDNCIRKSKDVPLSDFFAMKGSRRGSGGEGLDVLTEKCEVFVGSDDGGESYLEEGTSFSSHACSVGEMEKERKLTTETKDKNGNDGGGNRGGMRPSDPKFLLSVAVLGVLVLSSSRMR